MEESSEMAISGIWHIDNVPFHKFNGSIDSPDSLTGSSPVFTYEPWSLAVSPSKDRHRQEVSSPSGRPIFGRGNTTISSVNKSHPIISDFHISAQFNSGLQANHIGIKENGQRAQTSSLRCKERRLPASTRDKPQNRSSTRGGSRATYKWCALCARNGELTTYVMTHNLKDIETGCVTCPTLRRFVCPRCGATGDKAHTESYCPSRYIGRSATVALKKTMRNSTGLRPDYGR